GCGKTTRLMQIVEEHLPRFGPERIGFVSFTRAARREAKQRAVAAFQCDEAQLRHFATLHSIAFHAVHATRDEMVTDSKAIREAIGSAAGLAVSNAAPRSLDGDLDDTSATSREKGDTVLALWDFARNTMAPLEDAWRHTGICELSLDRVRWFVDRYETWKAAEGRLDFTDLLLQALDESVDLPALGLLCLDEAQDLSPLQWRMFHKLAENASHVVAAADDDQAVYEFQGADPAIFNRLPGGEEVLGQSYRLPRRVHAMAQRMIRRNRNRRDKTFEPRDDDGAVSQIDGLDELPIGDNGRWLILCRTNYQLAEVHRHLIDRGVVYWSKRSGPMRSHAKLRAYLTAQKLYDVQEVSAGDWAALAAHLKPTVHLERGWKTKLKRGHYARDGRVHINNLWTTWGAADGLVDAMQTGTHTFLTGEDFDFYRRVEKLHGLTALEETPHVAVSTIHGAKGSEADHVILSNGITRRIEDSMAMQMEPERRVWYVGATRAKRNLYVWSQGGRLTPRWGEW
ncbi:MAG TPA: ATP-dependent helicase, partial [Phycisphaerae bacterium]|nr:ATP-dependent helicase [Phycisphaerae bacterium]